MAFPLTVLAQPQEGNNQRFLPDHITHWAKEDVDRLVRNKVLTGIPEGALALEQPITRAQYIALVARAYGIEPIKAAASRFKDIPDDHWALGYIEALAQKGLVDGKQGGLFEPEKPVTREEAVVILARVMGAAGTAEKENALAGFADARSVSPWAREALAFAMEKGLLRGYPGGTLNPKKEVTRGEVAALVARSRYPVVTILHLNDLHGYIAERLDNNNKPFGGMARVATVVAETRRQNPWTLMVDSGDHIQGAPIANFFYGSNVIEAYNAIQLDLATFGNHEFDWGRETIEKRMNEAKYDYICANLIDSKSGQLFTGKGYVVKEVGPVTLGFTGLITPELPTLVNPKRIEGLQVLDPAAAAGEAAAALKKNGSVYNIVLSHLGFEEDKKLAQKVEGIDLIIGGHSHTRLDQPLEVAGVKIVQTGQHGENLGRIDLEFAVDRNGAKLLNMKYRLIPINESIKPDEKIKNLIKPYEEELNAKMDEVIGEALVDLVGEREKVRTSETNLGNFIADWMRTALGADIAITNAGGIRAGIAKGPIRVRDIYSVLPFDNLLVLVELTGSQVIEALENAYSKYPLADGRFAQISGIKVTIDPSREPGQRVTEVLVNGVPIDPQGKYKVATNDFLYNGGDGYEVFKNGKFLGWSTGEWMRDELIRYLRQYPKVNPAVEGRIIILNQQSSLHPAIDDKAA